MALRRLQSVRVPFADLRFGGHVAAQPAVNGQSTTDDALGTISRLAARVRSVVAVGLYGKHAFPPDLPESSNGIIVGVLHIARKGVYSYVFDAEDSQAAGRSQPATKPSAQSVSQSSRQ